MSSRSRTVTLLAATSCLLCAQGASADTLPRLQAQPDASSGGRIVDARGREVLLRGVNVSSLVSSWKGSDLPTAMPFTRGDARAIAGTGWNVVRLGVSWARIEPEPGHWDERYISEIQRVVEALGAQGVYTVIDFHQDAWGATLVARPDEVCAVGTEPALGWDGAPGWATLDDGEARCAGATREFSPAVRRAWESFWTDRPAADGVGVQTRYLATLEHVAQRFAGTEAVAGIDVMNEPGAVDEAQQAALGPFYDRAIAAIRRGEAAGGGFRHMIVLEPSALWNLSWSGPPMQLADTRGVVYSPHVYGVGLDGQPSAEPFDNARKEAAAIGGAPLLTGEWGSSPELAGRGDDTFFTAHLRLQDRTRTSSTLWTWKQSCGDPATILNLREQGEGYKPWAVYEMDCSGGKNKVVGPYAKLAHDLRRAYVRRAPGRLFHTSFRYGVLRGSGVRATKGDGPVEAWYPGRRKPKVAVRGTRQAVIQRQRTGGWRILAQPTGGSWTLQAYAPGT